MRDEAKRRETQFKVDLAKRQAPGVPRETKKRGETVFYEVSFDAGPLGLSIDADPVDARRPPPVIRVSAGGPAEAKGVAVGDVLVSVGGKHDLSYEGVLEELPKLPRPVVLAFARRGAPAEDLGPRDAVVLEAAVAEAPRGPERRDARLLRATANVRKPPLEAAVAASAAKRRVAAPPPVGDDDDDDDTTTTTS